MTTIETRLGKITGKKVAHQERFFVGLAACAKQ